MHDLICSQEFLGIQSLVQNKNRIGVCSNKQILEVQVIPYSEKTWKKKPKTKTPWSDSKAEFYLNE